MAGYQLQFQRTTTAGAGGAVRDGGTIAADVGSRPGNQLDALKVHGIPALHDRF